MSSSSSLIHAHSCPCTKSELDLFTVPPTQLGIEDALYMTYNPVTSVTNEGPITFNIPAAGEDCLDLAHTMLYIKAKVVKNDGTALDAAANVAPMNNFLHTLFQSVEVSFNNKIVNPSAGIYPYRSYIETLLNYGCDAKDSHLT